ncbi:MAG: mannosyltransferase [Peltula sp. TS41687]|nr:MAG: mannosyltransferase [Peltula sp. TS41687]
MATARNNINYATESDPHPDLLSQASISIVPISQSPAVLKTENKYLFLVLGPLKVLWQVWQLWLVLAYQTEPAEWLLMQNPPSIPTLAVALLVCFLRNTKLIIDWHNYGWSILGLRLGQAHPLVRIARRYEHFFGRLATANLTVTDVMARSLKGTYGVRSPILPLHDRPASHFQPLSQAQRAEFLHRLPETTHKAAAILSGMTCLLVSSTSWTADEDFSLLLDALVSYSTESRRAPASLPAILAIITGKGPQQAYYRALISRLNVQNKLTNVTIVTAWLSTSDYAALLGAADLGVSLHVSSSGLDLPMKVVDMFGAGLPVVGWGRFEAWGELVREGVNGRGFGSARELSALLVALLAGEERRELRRLKQGARREGETRWDDEWNPRVGRLLGLCTSTSNGV